MPQNETRSPRRLVDILRALPSGELDSLIARLGIAIVSAKRIDAPAQVARALVSLPEVRDPSRLPNASAELLHRIAEARGSLFVPSIPVGLEPLAARGLVFARARGDVPPSSGAGRSSPVPGAIELVLPHAFLVQLRSWEGEDPRGIRALLAQAPFDTLSAIAGHYLGRPATPPIALSLEAAWEALADSAKLAEEVERLAPVERRLLEALEREGGEVDTEELLDLEREPMRLRTAGGATPSRRGVGFALERRGFLVPVHPNRHVVPTEVSAVVGAANSEAREQRRAQIRGFVLDTDHAPRRARFADDAVPLTIALAFAIREPNVEVREAVGTPRSLITRLAQRFGRDPEVVALIAALSRALGLWDASALSVASPPGSYALHELPRALYLAWIRGGAWDEARPEAEVLRLAPEARDSSPVGVIREMVLDAMRELGEGRWLPWEAVAGYVRDDARTAGVARLLRRWAERAGVEAPTPVAIARRIALESLPALGAVDLGVMDMGRADPEAEEHQHELGPTLRLTPRGRALLSEKHPTAEPVPSRFVDAQVLRLGPQARVANVLALSSLIDVGKVAEHIDLVLSPASLARALSAGVEADVVRSRIEAIAALPEPLLRLIAQASVVVGKAHMVASGGFVWVEDASVRDLLRTRRQTADLFIDPSPPGGLLLHAGVDFERLARRCRALGVEVTYEGPVSRLTRSGTSPPSSVPAPASTGRRASARPRDPE